jgi:hypothetical protein
VHAFEVDVGGDDGAIDPVADQSAFALVVQLLVGPGRRIL